MISVARRSVLTITIAFLSVLSTGIGWTNGPGVISEIRLSPDFKRLIVKSEGQVALQQTLKINRPPRLVIDFKGARLANIPRIVQYQNEPVREIRTGKHGTGVRVVLEFGDYAVPEYRIRKIDDYFIVFMGDLNLANPGDLLPAKADNSVHGKWSHTPGKNPQAGSDASRLFIKTAEVTDGRIILQVARANQPNRHYQVELDLDLKRRGFKMAYISPLQADGPDSMMVASNQRSLGRSDSQRQAVSGAKKKTHAKGPDKKKLADKGLFDLSDLTPDGKGLFNLADFRRETNGPRRTKKSVPATQCSFSAPKNWPLR